jgi:hypothetical protein
LSREALWALLPAVPTTLSSTCVVRGQQGTYHHAVGLLQSRSRAAARGKPRLSDQRLSGKANHTIMIKTIYLIGLHYLAMSCRCQPWFARRGPHLAYASAASADQMIPDLCKFLCDWYHGSETC